MALLPSMKEDLFREPRKRKYNWLPVGFGTLILVLSIVGIFVDGAQGVPFSGDPEYVILGVAFITMGGSELLPVDQRRVIALLRVVALGAFVSFGAAYFLTT